MSSRIELLRQSLAILAAPAPEQLKYLESLGIPGVIDELAEDYHDMALAARPLYAQGEITGEARDCILSLDDLMDKMSGGPEKAEFWSETALASAKEWQDIRGNAKRCLELLNSVK